MALEQDVAALSVLVEPQRRRLYEALAATTTPRTLGEVAAELGIGRTLAAFHLNKLTEAGLVEAVAAAPVAGRRGRPSRTFRLTAHEVSAAVPARRYDLVAEVLLAAASEQQPGEPLEAAARRTARARGVALAQDVKPDRRSGPRRRVELVLASLGYRPAREGPTLVLRNCPFSRLRDTDVGLVCGINHGLAEGYVEGVGAAGELTAELRPCGDNCCVVVTPAATAT
ncbi:MAG: helix-turn-helix domain-containing protein [Actinobacteria bacterium]|nr:helix-turn-helix domain-containing protein [Actinomycetota bacterium]